MLFSSPAYAQAATAATPEAGAMSFVPLILIFLVFYILLIRPQQKKMRAMEAMITALKKGDEIITSGGIVGKVINAGDERELLVQIADGVQIRVMRNTVAGLYGAAAAKNSDVISTEKSAKPARNKKSA